MEPVRRREGSGVVHSALVNRSTRDVRVRVLACADSGAVEKKTVYFGEGGTTAGEGGEKSSFCVYENTPIIDGLSDVRSEIFVGYYIYTYCLLLTVNNLTTVPSTISTPETSIVWPAETVTITAITTPTVTTPTEVSFRDGSESGEN